MTFGELLDAFERDYMPKLSTPTRQKYGSLLRQHIRPDLAALQVEQVTVRGLDAWLNLKADAGLSWASRSDLRNLVSSVFNRADRWGLWEGRNPARLAYAGRKTAVREKRKLTVAQTEKLLKALPADVRIVCMIGLFCGLRVSEVLGLQWKHVDFDRGMLLIRQRYYRGDLDRTKAEKSDRDVPFGDLGETLRKLRPEPDADEKFCFDVRTCAGITRNDCSMRRYFLRPAAEKLGIYYPGFGFHAFRREAVTGIAAGSDAIQASRVAGHSRMDVTLLYGLDDYARQMRAVKSLQEPFVTAGLLGGRAK